MPARVRARARERFEEKEEKQRPLDDRPLQPRRGQSQKTKGEQHKNRSGRVLPAEDV